MHRFHEQQPFRKDEPVTLSPEVAHHLVRVLRTRKGEEIVVFNGEGGEWRARVEEADRRQVTITPLAFNPEDRMPALHVTVALPLIKGERMDYALQKATELGVAEFRPLMTERTEVRLDQRRLEKKMLHWKRVIVSACEQCGRNRIPLLHEPATLTKFLQEAQPAGWIACADGGTPADALPSADARTLTILTGPEGGFSAAEHAQAEGAGLRPVRLGQRILRAETAPTVMLAALWALRGEG